MMCKVQPLVSIIMPVYNCENYLAESIGSVVSQSYQNWELLVIDDGSDDGSVSIIESYVEEDDRIRLYKNETGEHGPGIARNYGMNFINGKYTYFIDADDWIDKELLWDTVSLAERTNADIVPFGFLIEDNGEKKKKPLKPCGNFEFQDFKKIANEIVRGTWSECHELIRSDVVRDVRHNSFKTCEDICFQMDLLCNVIKVCGIDKEYYHYRVVNNSLSHNDKWDEMFVKTAIVLWEKERKFLEYCGLNEDDQTMKNAAIERYTACLYWLCHKNCTLTFSEKCRQIKHIGNLMNIQAFKENYKWNKYAGVRKIAKLCVTYNMEMVMMLLGTVYFKMRDKTNND